MEYWVVGFVAFGASLLTFFSGFGLGTILTPVFMVFFPIELAIAMTAIVHFLNNIFKFSITFKDVNWPLAIRFCSTAFIFSILGAWVLQRLGASHELFSYQLFGITCHVSLLKWLIAFLMLVFVLLELHPTWSKISFSMDKIYLGGALSGFFGGLAGFQGALRSMFLLRAGLTKEVYISTGIFIACTIDIARLMTYFNGFSFSETYDYKGIMMVSIICAFLGALLGKSWLKKVTIQFVQYTVSILLTILAILLAVGII